VHYWADLQSGHGLCCCGNITRTQDVREYMLVLAVCLVIMVLFIMVFICLMCVCGFKCFDSASWTISKHLKPLKEVVICCMIFVIHRPLTV